MVIPEKTCGRHHLSDYRQYEEVSFTWATHSRPHIDQSGPSPLIPLLASRRVIIRQPLPGAHERPGDVRTEFDGDPERDDEVDEGDGVQADMPVTHDAHDVEDG